MKKIKSLFCILILSTFLVGNVFAVEINGSGSVSFFDNIIKIVVSLIAADCEGRQCQNCKPGDEENGNCKPPRI